ncbi:MAG: hypothetical protein NC044_05655 [Prevotella sp.]|nr:hypothetical protein [Lachnospiraceae bacterium]MCM1379524.1 hypothetical protein [Bacteroides sp.]MCM1445873.1 hypothetical protein [Prevotella sp.]
MAKSFIELYREKCDEPTPLQSFIDEVARVTNRSTYTVKQWASGKYVPDINARNLLAAHFNCNPDDLFPTHNNATEQ